jgi:protein involved in polysaccharide export with SLBB domain
MKGIFMRMKTLRVLLTIMPVAAILALPFFSAECAAAPPASSPFSPATIPSLSPAEAMALQEAAQKGELTPEVRQIVQNNPELKKYLPSKLREELEAETEEGGGLDNAALLKLKEEAEGKDKKKDKEKEARERKLLRVPYDWKKSVYVSRLFQSRLKDEEKEQLVHFGHDLFDPRPDAAATGDSMPVSDDYVIGYGDEILVRLWGRMEGSHRMKVDRDGKIFFPKLGPIYVAGKTFGEVKSILRARVGSIAEVRSDISLGQVKGFQVSILGEVGKPGRFQVSSYHTVIQLLTTAWGVRDIGSLRRVQIKRGKETVREVDIYDFLLEGDTTQDILLRAGDAVFVPVAGPFVAVAGEVRRQAIYELKQEKTIAEVLKMAGGLAPSAYKRRLQVERLEGNRARTVADLNLEEASSSLSSFALQDGDILRVLAVLSEDENAVTVEGNVQRPGKYQWKEGLTVGGLVGDEKFFLPDTFLDYAMITRLVGAEKRKEAVAVNLRKIVIDKERAADVPLKPEDTLSVYRRSAFRDEVTATVGGEVRDPGEYEIIPGMRVSDLVKLAGDLTPNAFLPEAELSRVDEKQNVTIHKIDLARALSGDRENDPLLQYHDHLMVRALPDLQDIRYITLAGEVRSPGIYTARKGERLSSVIRRAGGFTKEAFLRGAVFTRLSVQKRQQELIDRTVEQLEQEVSRTAAKEGATALDKEDIEAQKAIYEARKALLAKLKQVRAQGRVIVRLSEPEKLEGTENDLLIEQGDKLEVSRPSEVVNVTGRVYNPTGIVYNRTQDSAGYYLRKVGGPTEDADRDHIFVVKADGSVTTKEQADEGLWLFGEKGILATRIEPGDSIVVPEKLVFTRFMKDVKDITQILYQIAVTAGVLLVAF